MFYVGYEEFRGWGMMQVVVYGTMVILRVIVTSAAVNDPGTCFELDAGH